MLWICTDVMCMKCNQRKVLSSRKGLKGTSTVASQQICTCPTTVLGTQYSLQKKGEKRNWLIYLYNPYHHNSITLPELENKPFVRNDFEIVLVAFCLSLSSTLLHTRPDTKKAFFDKISLSLSLSPLRRV